MARASEHRAPDPTNIVVYHGTHEVAMGFEREPTISHVIDRLRDRLSHDGFVVPTRIRLDQIPNSYDDDLVYDLKIA